MKVDEGNDSLDTFIRQAVGKEPLFSLSRTGDNPVHWIQYLHRLDQQDLPSCPLLAPMKFQMQKCDKCGRYFGSPMNCRRRTRVHRRSLNFHKVKACLADKDAEALRCHKLHFEEEEAAQNRQAELLTRKRQRNLRQKERRIRDQLKSETGNEHKQREQRVVGGSKVWTKKPKSENGGGGNENMRVPNDALKKLSEQLSVDDWYWFHIRDSGKQSSIVRMKLKFFAIHVKLAESTSREVLGGNTTSEIEVAKPSLP